MSTAVANLEPNEIWKNFANLNEVPRPSKKEERVIAFMQDFGKSLGLETLTDKTGNVLIKKPASAGMEDRKKIVLQSHLDMVHQKNNDTVFDFDKEGIRMFIEGDWVKAEGTTLGADNGIGVATIMGLLESTTIAHPAFEALFTVDEETGMTGAFGIEPNFLEGDILLNLDTEDDDELTIGCAGGVNVNAHKEFKEEAVPADYATFEFKIKGLSGGHSGMEIHKGLGNANKLMNRLIYQLSTEIELGIQQIEGGGLRNAIPRESNAIVAIPASSEEKFTSICNSFKKDIADEYKLTDPKLSFDYKSVEGTGKMLSPSDSKSITQAIYAVPNGIIRMSPSMEDTVQTSNNLSQVILENGKLSCLCLCRSAVDSEKEDAVRAIQSAFTIIDADFSTDGDYPGWTPQPQSDIVELMNTIYQEKFNEKPRIMAGHGGLECGIIGSNYPDLDMVSFGPIIRGPHSPDEKVKISSVQKFWDFLLETLKQIPSKN
ncbi:MAG: aminoacyl-histidine dipeptidase [Vicingaceae bacterium]